MSRVPVALSVVVVAALSFWMGRQSAPPTPDGPSLLPPAAPSAGAAGPIPRRAAPAAPHVATLPPAIAELRDALASDARWQRDPEAALNSLVDEMSRRELTTILQVLTGRTGEELDEIEDLHRFARSTASAVLAGLVTPPGADAEQAVEFASTLSPEQSDLGVREFRATEDRVYGVFALEEGARQTVVAKWFRVDEPELLFFDEVEVVEEDGRGYVTLEHEAGTGPAEYRLEIFSSGRELELVASGAYRTESAPR